LLFDLFEGDFFMHAPRFALVAILSAFVSMIGAQSALALPIVNGSLTGPIANGVLAFPFSAVPTGWLEIVTSPDTMDENNNVGLSGVLLFGATPSPSPDGGTWVGLAAAGGPSESFGQSIGGFTVGTVYSVSWYQANFGFDTYHHPDVVEVLVDGVVVGNGSLAPLAPGWTSENVEFTATAVSHVLSFRPGNVVGDSYLSIDGISVRVPCCTYDVDADGTVGLGDVAVVNSCHFVPPSHSEYCEPADVNCDGVINSVDATCILCEIATPGNPACCDAPNVSTQSPGVFCIDADGDGSDWSWQLDATAPVTVTGPVPSAAEDLRDAFVSSVNLAAIAGLSATPGPGAACFTVAYSSSFQFWVGPPGGPVTCLVTGNPLGCSFNPMIYEQVSLPVPALGPWSLAALAGALSAIAVIGGNRRRARPRPTRI